MKIYKLSRVCEDAEGYSFNEDTYLTHEKEFSEEAFEEICRDALKKKYHTPNKDKSTSTLTLTSKNYLESFLIENYGFKQIPIKAEFEYGEWY